MLKYHPIFFNFKIEIRPEMVGGYRVSGLFYSNRPARGGNLKKGRLYTHYKNCIPLRK